MGCLLLFLGPAHAATAVGSDAPAFLLPTTADAQLGRSQLEGKATLLNFWATWCAPCLAELPMLDALSERLEGSDAQVITLNIDRRRPPVDATIKRLELSLLVGLDPDGAVVGLFDPAAMPTSYVMDKAGEVVEVLRGALSEEDIEALEGRLRKLAE